MPTVQKTGTFQKTMKNLVQVSENKKSTRNKISLHEQILKKTKPQNKTKRNTVSTSSDLFLSFKIYLNSEYWFIVAFELAYRMYDFIISFTVSKAYISWTLVVI